jgi:hypothetical protein
MGLAAIGELIWGIARSLSQLSAEVFLSEPSQRGVELQK